MHRCHCQAAADMLKSKDELWKRDRLAAALPTLATCGHVLRVASPQKRRVVSGDLGSSPKLRHVAQHFGRTKCQEMITFTLHLVCF